MHCLKSDWIKSRLAQNDKLLFVNSYAEFDIFKGEFHKKNKKKTIGCFVEILKVWWLN